MEKIREDRARRALHQLGMRLHKTPARSWLRQEYGPGYMVTENNIVVFGSWNRMYQGTLEEIEEFVTDQQRKTGKPQSRGCLMQGGAYF